MLTIVAHQLSGDDREIYLARALIREAIESAPRDRTYVNKPSIIILPALQGDVPRNSCSVSTIVEGINMGYCHSH